MQPSLFLSHGAPTLALSAAPAAEFVRTLPNLLPSRPDAVLIASAHWETAEPQVTSRDRNTTIHDFGGFPEAFYQIQYPAPGSPQLAREAISLLNANGLKATEDTKRGLDHGAWVPLLLAWPKADIPVVQLSLQSHSGPRHHLSIGRALAPLRNQNVLIIGSGSWTHDLRSVRGQDENAPAPEWVSRFADWADRALVEKRTEDLLNYRKIAPDAVANHPTEEHFLPLYVAMGAGGDAAITRLHRSTTFGVLQMDAYAFGL